MSGEETKAKVAKAPLPLRASVPKIAVDSPELPTLPSMNVSTNDRPTPRSTVIPRLPAPMTLSGMRPKLETLIFHGAPPVPPATPPKGISPIMLPPPMMEAFQDVHSSELLSDAELEDDDRDTPYQAPEHDVMAARTDRPPPIVIPMRGRREPRVIAAITAALLVPIAVAAFVFDRAPRASHVSQVVTTSAPAVAAAPRARVPGTCVVDGAPKLLARRALVRGGVESTTFDDRVAFAALSSTKSGTAFELDARTLTVKGSAKIVASDTLLHVVPELGGDAPIDAQGDTGGLRTIADAEGDAVFGVRDGFAVWGPRDATAANGLARLWKLSWPQAIEAPRVAPLGTSGERAVVFRRAGAIWIGSFRGAVTTSDLTKLSIAKYAGAPSLDARGDEAIVAWAERDGQSPWGIRWTRWTPHAGPGAVHELALPEGGPGDRAMAPSVAARGDGRFLLSWTEAGRGRNQVRAEVIDANDHPMGDALLVSPADTIAGQEAIALTDSGRGAIAYLVAKRGAFELRATAIDCVP